METHDTREIHHEESDVNVRAIFLFCAGLVAVGVAVTFAVWLMFQYLSSREAVREPIAYPHAAGRERRRPEASLEANPAEGLPSLSRPGAEGLT